MKNFVVKEKCIMCNTNKKFLDSNKNKWMYDKDICKDCNEYLLNNSPFYQVEYVKGHSYFSEKIKGILMISNFDNLKRIFFFSKNYKKIEIPIESIANCTIINDLDEKITSKIDTINSNYNSELFLNITYLDDSKLESPVFIIEKLRNAVKSIKNLTLDYEKQKYNNLQFVEVINAVKKAKNDFDLNLNFQNEEDEIIASKITEPIFILKKRLALGEISEDEYFNLKSIIRA